MTNIPALPKELLSLIRQGEDYKIEYKEATNKIPKNLYDTVSSFSNREGGDIFLGVHDCCVIMGVDEAAINSLISTFVTAVNNEDIISPALYLTAQAYYYNSDGTFSAVDRNGRTLTEQAGRHYILHIHVPVSPNVIRHSSKIYDRNGDSDVDITKHSDLVFQCYARKQSTFYVNKVFPHWKVSDLRPDLIERARQMASARRRREGKGAHPWENMDDEEMLRSSNLILTDEQGNTGITLAAILLFGTNNMIASACAQHKTDCIYRVYNVDRYDDRDVIDPTNLFDSYDRMFDFGQKHLNDEFVLDGIVSVSARNAILREIISDTLSHRDYSSHYIARMVITKDAITVENGNRAHGMGMLNIKTFQPFPKNPPISKIFREVGYADELGSGMRNCYKYTKLYSGGEPEFIEGDVFKIIIPLSTGAMTKVGPVSTQTEYAGSTQDSTQADTQVEPITINLDAERLNALLDYCSEPRSRDEMQGFCGIKTREYFRKKILVPMIKSGKVRLTIPDKPSSPKQKYVRA